MQMPSFLRDPRVAWIVAGALLLALVVVLAIVALRPGGDESYESRAVRFAAEHGAQALKMKFDAQSPGPLRDTVIQRWHDPVDGTVCYIYLPVAVPHSAGPPGLVQYGQAAIGSISCLPGP
jgi:hypothetical protein